MGTPIVIGYFIIGVPILVALLFIGISLWEREFRAVFVSVGTFALLTGIIVVVFEAGIFGGDGLGFGLLCFATVPILIILGIKTPNRSIRFVESQPRVDERDAVFHRFLRIRPGTREFDSYYEMYPEKKEFDKSVNAMPRMDEPGSKSYDPLTSPYMSALFSVVEGISRDLDWRANPVDGSPVIAPKEVFSMRIKGFGRYLGACQMGCTALNQAYVYSHIGRSPGPFGTPIKLAHKNAIVIAVPLDHNMMRHAPKTPTITNTGLEYLEVAKIAMVIARYINFLGYDARAHVDGNYRVMCVPIAADAGIGELGRSGLLISPKYGSRIRLAVVTTNLPLKKDKPIAFGVQDFCNFCKKCAHNCPSGSVDAGDKAVRSGVEKWQSRRDSCYRHWRTVGSDCGLCIKVCPYSHQNNLLHDSVRWLVRRNHVIRRAAFIGDELVYGRKPNVTYPIPKWHEKTP